MAGEKGKKGNILSALLFVYLTAAFFLGGISFEVGGFNVYPIHIVLAALVLLGCFGFLRSPDIPVFLEIVRLSGVLMLQIFVCLIISMLIYLFHFTEPREMITGFFRFAYLFIAIAAAGILVYLLREKAIPFLFWVLVSEFLLNVAVQMHEVGAGEFFRQLYVLLASFAGETGSAMAALEALSLDRCFAFCLFYFFWFRKRDGKGRFYLRAGTAILCMLIGLKRGAVLSMIAACAVCFLYRFLPARFRKPYINLLILGMLSYSILIIPLIRYGVLERIADYFQIDSTGRFTLYNIYARYYEISPFYAGKGFGWVDSFKRVAESREFDYHTITGVHDEYVRSYIELGFWGYLLWILSIFPWVLKKMAKTDDQNGSAIVIGCVTFLAVTYTFSNIYMYTINTMVYAAVLIAARMAFRDDGEIQDIRKAGDQA